MSDKIKNRDYTLIIDKSGSMSTKDQEDGKNRWEIMQESILALVRKCQELDPDGITIYTYRFQPQYSETENSNEYSIGGDALIYVNDNMDDASPDNISDLVRAADRFIDMERHNLERLVKNLNTMK